jgi:hypothetical protein
MVGPQVQSNDAHGKQIGNGNVGIVRAVEVEQLLVVEMRQSCRVVVGSQTLAPDGRVHVHVILSLPPGIT